MPNRMRHRPRPVQGFSLLELLVVISLAMVLLVLAANTYTHATRRMEVQGEAEALAGLLRSARQYAMDHGTRTRVVFADPELDRFTDGVLTSNRSYAAYALYLPNLPNGGTELMPFKYGDHRGSSYLLEFAAMPFTSIPSGFVAQWRPMPGEEEWRTPPARIGLRAIGWPKSSLKRGYTQDFFTQTLAKKGHELPRQTRVAYLGEYYFNPRKFWDHQGTRYFYPNIPSARYPQNYFQTPYPLAYPLVIQRSMPDEPSKIEDPATSRFISYAEMWGENQEYRYFSGIPEQLGDFIELGRVESAATPRRRFFNLRGIEFNNRGQPELRWAEQVVIRVTSQPNERNVYDIVIDRVTGIAKIKRLDNLEE
ncbi:MAG: prepilin-type N-terminal cleavage/methylation domain-containing protein [Verrucomicrobiota bacterium]